jgi:hypothetical protein
VKRVEVDAVIAHWWRHATVTALALSGLFFVIALERSSVERGNRLHRSGALPKAASIYRGRTDAESPRPALRYNLGTSLLELGSSSAEAELAIGTGSEDEQVRALALYNIGVSRLLRAVAAEGGDSMRVHAAVSVEANRSTLRLNPEQPAAKWNLAMAQRMLDSLDAANRRQGMSSADELGPSDDRLRADNTIEVEEESTSIGAPPLDGEEEALAQLLDAGPLSIADAIEILEATGLDGSVILGKLLALESRARWGRQLGKPGPKR